MNRTVHVPKMMCGGCAETITNSLLPLEGVQQVEVDVEQKSVTVEMSSDSMSEISQKLSEIGYPIQE